MADHLTPHDLVTYSRCPHEMELTRLRSAPDVGILPAAVAQSKRAERTSPLLLPPLTHVSSHEGRIDLSPEDLLVYVDEHERGLPILFAPECIRLDPTLTRHGPNLVDGELRLIGRPDFVILRTDGNFVPIEYKATHLFPGHFGFHGRTFDVIQAIAECRLVQAVTGRTPPLGIVLYGDTFGSGDHEGWIEVPYTETEEHWLKYAVRQVRGDTERPPVPHERNCYSCQPNRDGLCQFSACGYSEPRR